MAKRSGEKHESVWSFRREITLGTLLQLVTLVVVLVAAWVNLQKDMVLIHHELARLVQVYDKLQQHIECLTEESLEHEYRLQALEQQDQQRSRG